MNSGDIVYVVTVGEYSDYRIEGVFSSPKLAQKHIRRLNTVGRFPIPEDKYSIEEWEVDGTSETNRFEGNVPTRTAHWVVQSEDGRIIVLEPLRRGQSPPPAAFVVWAIDVDHAVKIAADQLAIARAKREGIA